MAGTKLVVEYGPAPVGHSCEDDGWCQYIHPAEEVEVGVCWCGAYGTAGRTHYAKPSPDEPLEECGTYL
jgi:hypothetical protein